MASGSGLNLWVWLAGNGIYGFGCKEVCRFPHITYPLLLLYLFFFAEHPYILFIFKMFFVL